MAGSMPEVQDRRDFGDQWESKVLYPGCEIGQGIDNGRNVAVEMLYKCSGEWGMDGETKFGYLGVNRPVSITGIPETNLPMATEHGGIADLRHLTILGAIQAEQGADPTTYPTTGQ